MSPIYVDLATAAKLTSLSESTIQTLEARGEFPRKRRISSRRSSYLYRELVEWAENCPVSDLLPPPNTGAPKPKIPQPRAVR